MSTGAEKCQFRTEKSQFGTEKCQFKTGSARSLARSLTSLNAAMYTALPVASFSQADRGDAPYCMPRRSQPACGKTQPQYGATQSAYGLRCWNKHMPGDCRQRMPRTCASAAAFEMTWPLSATAVPALVRLTGSSWQPAACTQLTGTHPV